MKHCNGSSPFIFNWVNSQVFDFDFLSLCLFQIRVHKTQFVVTCFYLVYPAFQIIVWV